MQSKFIKIQIHLKRIKVNSITTKGIRASGRTNEVTHASYLARQGCASTLLPMCKYLQTGKIMRRLQEEIILLKWVLN